MITKLIQVFPSAPKVYLISSNIITFIKKQATNDNLIIDNKRFAKYI